MAGDTKNLIICTIDINDELNIAFFDDDSVLQVRDNYAFIDNVFYPFDYFLGVQSLDEKQYEELIGDLA